MDKSLYYDLIELAGDGPTPTPEQLLQEMMHNPAHGSSAYDFITPGISARGGLDDMAGGKHAQLVERSAVEQLVGALLGKAHAAAPVAKDVALRMAPGVGEYYDLMDLRASLDDISQPSDTWGEALGKAAGLGLSGLAMIPMIPNVKRSAQVVDNLRDSGVLTNRRVRRLLKEQLKDVDLDNHPAYLKWADDDEPARWLHGTPSHTIDRFDPEMQGMLSLNEGAEYGTFFANLPDDANYYATKVDDIPNVRASREMQNAETLQFKAQRDIEMFSGRDDELSRMIVEEAVGQKAAAESKMAQILARPEMQGRPTVYPVHLSAQNPYVVDMARAEASIDDAMLEAHQSGYDSVLLFDSADPTPNATHMAVLDPEQIHGALAKFKGEK
jgi:hypothetical protein